MICSFNVELYRNYVSTVWIMYRLCKLFIYKFMQNLIFKTFIMLGNFTF